MTDNSSDSSNATSSSNDDSDHPRTPPLAAAPRSPAKTGRPLMAPSKIPRLSTASVSKVQAPVSPPRTPADRDTAPAALDWGSGGEWSALVGETKRGVAQVESDAVEDVDDASPVEVSEEKEEPIPQSTMASSGLFDDFEHAAVDLQRSFHSVQPKEVSDNDDDPLIVFEDTDQQDATASQTSNAEHSDIHYPFALKERSNATESFDGFSDDEDLPVVSVLKEPDQHIVEQYGPHETVEQEADLAGADASQTTGSDSDMHPASVPKQSGDTDYLERASDEEEHTSVSGSKDVDQRISEQQVLHENAMQERGLSDADVSHTSDSDVSPIELPAAIIRGPFLNVIDRKLAAGIRASVSPEMVLRGLIRDAHPEKIHFTLPHSSFSPDNLRGGLQFAYSMLQAATSKLAMLELLDNVTTSMTGADLRRWIALADKSNPRGQAEPRISVIFESLSIGEMRAALEELVQSRLVVEGEAEKTQMSLMKKVVAKERQERSVVIPVQRAADVDKGDFSSKKRRVSEEDDETMLDAFLTATMILLMGVLYLYVRE
ncbi:hypothetical protein MBLNU13_g06077t1 [Cladosporium sp. NU13]